MALQEVTGSLLKRLRLSPAPINQIWRQQCCKQSTEAGQELGEMEQSEFQGAPQQEFSKSFDPVGNARRHKGRLPPSRYSYRPPKYYRGPLHPHQPPPSSDPASREFVPGPFSLPRLEQTYHDTVASDLMTLSYAHYPPGTRPAQKGERLRTWVGDSPYFKNRPLRGPRGGEVLRLLNKPITFRNVPQLKRVTVHSMVKGAITDSSHLHVAGMVLQAITGVRATPHTSKKAYAVWDIKARQYLSVTCDLHGEDMYHFLSKLVDVVMPRIKDWRGVKGSSGDNSGHISMGLKPDEVALFPEVEVNYDMYPPKMIPGCHITMHTTATNDRDARMLLASIGVPFYGKLIN